MIELNEQLMQEIDRLRAENEALLSALRSIENMTPVHGLNPNAKISDPSRIKVCWNTQLAARSALAVLEAK